MTPEADGVEPDARFTYANERTFLAWNRTALALIATGVAATQLLPRFDFDFGRRALGLPLIALGGFVAVTSYREWRSRQGAMRRGEPLPHSRVPTILAGGISVLAVVAIVLAVLET